MSTVLFENFVQALASALVSTLFGVLGAIGIAFVKDHSRYEWLSLLPNFLPPLFIVTATLSMIHPFPYGLEGIVLLHALLNIGLVSVMLGRQIRYQTNMQNLQSMLFGHSKWCHFRFVLLPHLVKNFRYPFLFVFAVCFTSFSIPFVASGGKWLSMELSIYQLIKFEGDMSTASIYGLVQLVFIYLFLSLYRSPGLNKSIRTVDSDYQYNSFCAVPLGISIGMFCVFLYELTLNYKEVVKYFVGEDFLYRQVVTSLGVAIMVGLFLMLFFLAVGALFLKIPKLRIHQWDAPSMGVMGLVLIGVSYSLPNLVWVKVLLLVFGLSVAYYFTLHRWGWKPFLDSLEPQKQLANLYELKLQDRFRVILKPCGIRVAAQVGALGAVWALGDYSITSFLMSSDQSLGLYGVQLLGSYNSHLSVGLIFMISAIGGGVYFLLRGFGRAFD